MKILFIDYIFQKGHVHFNRIHIDSLKAQGYEVRLALYEAMAAQLPYTADEYDVVIPQRYEQCDGHPLQNRINFLRALRYIQSHVRLDDYDKLIVSSWDEVTLGLLPLRRDMYLICHANAANLANRVKGGVIRRMNRLGCHFIVFNDYMAAPFAAHGIRRVHIVGHGCIAPFTDGQGAIPDICKGYRRVIFHPSAKADAAFVDELFAHERLQRYLADTGTLLLLRHRQPRWADTEQIRFIEAQLSMEDYEQLFLHSYLILLAYSDGFAYQVSGVSYEAVANRKPMAILQHPSLDYCKAFYDYDPRFANAEELLELLQQLDRTAGRCIVTAADLTPDYSFLRHA